MTPVTPWEYFLIFSPVPATIVALLVLAIPPLDDLAPHAVTAVLDGFCPAAVPNFWCRIPRPAPWMAAVHAFIYVVFLVVSIHMFFWIRFGRYEKPRNYVPGSLPLWHQVTAALIWLFMVIGGQVFPLRAPPLSYVGLLFPMLGLTFAIMMTRGLAISLRFRQP
jgi:hypothetical protein